MKECGSTQSLVVMTVRVFDKYEIIRRIAVGGMGEIFLARQTGVAGFDRLVILKSLLPDLAKEKGFIDQFLDEARVAATLNHPNIVAIYEVGLWQGVYFIAMEYIKGATVAELLMDLHGDEGHIPIVVASRIIMDAATALDHAHFAKTPEGENLNIVHRDISPQNIMVRDDGVTKVVDFGIAKAANRAVRTATGAVKGKLTYMPPEQLGGKKVDGRSDQFALGICLWEMCAMERLFHADNPLQTVQLITQRPIPRLSEKIEGFPKLLDQIVARMLERDPDKRYDRCKDAAADLRRFLDSYSQSDVTVQVADFVQTALGDQLERHTADLTPKHEDFLLHLRNADGEEFGRVETPADGTVEVELSGLHRSRQKRAKRLGVVAMALSLALITGASGWFFGFFDNAAVKNDENAVVAVQLGPPVTVPDPIIPPPKVSFTSQPSAVSLFVNNELRGRTPVTLELKSGESRVIFSKGGYVDRKESLTLKEGEVREFSVVLEREQRKKRTPAISPAPAPPKPSPSPAQSKPGTLAIRTVPWTTVSIGGRHLGSTPIGGEKLPPGKYVVRLRNPRAKIDEKRKVTIRSGKRAVLDLKL